MCFTLQIGECVNHKNWLFCTDLHAVLPDFLDEVTRVGRGFYMESVLIGSCCCHGLHPLLWSGYHHMHVCNKAKGKQSPQTNTEQTLQCFTYLVYPRGNVYLGIRKVSENMKEPRVSTSADY